MQHRSDAYQAIISITRLKETGGIPYQKLVEQVAPFVDAETAKSYRISRLKKTPHETSAETIAKGQKDLARKYIDAANRQGLILYGNSSPTLIQEGHPDKRYVYWRRPARSGGRYGIPETKQEERAHEAFSRYLRID